MTPLDRAIAVRDKAVAQYKEALKEAGRITERHYAGRLEWTKQGIQPSLPYDIHTAMDLAWHQVELRSWDMMWAGMELLEARRAAKSPLNRLIRWWKGLVK